MTDDYAARRTTAWVEIRRRVVSRLPRMALLGAAFFIVCATLMVLCSHETLGHALTDALLVETVAAVVASVILAAVLFVAVHTGLR